MFRRAGQHGQHGIHHNDGSNGQRSLGRDRRDIPYTQVSTLGFQLHELALWASVEPTPRRPASSRKDDLSNRDVWHPSDALCCFSVGPRRGPTCYLEGSSRLHTALTLSSAATVDLMSEE